MNGKNKRKSWVRIAVALSVVAVPAAAQQDPAAVKVEKIEVTGSHIKRVDAEGPAPLTVITREELDRSPYLTLMEVLLSLPMSTGPAFTDNGTGAAGISLRGLGPQSTLVLLNGRRVSNYGWAAGFANSVHFVDLNALPATAVERVEVLRDGASAIYGSDAIAGVVNVVTRKDYEGAEARAGYGASKGGDAAETTASASFGWGNLSRDGYNVLAVADYFRREPVLLSKVIPTFDLRSRGDLDYRSAHGSPGTWLTAGRGGYTANTVFPDCPPESRDQDVDFRGTCAFNQSPYQSYVPRTERWGLFARGTAALTSGMRAFAEASLSDNEDVHVGLPLATNATSTIVLPVGHVSNPFPFAVPIRYRFLDVGPTGGTMRSRTTRLLAGLQGNVGEWDWEAALLDGRNTMRGYGSNAILAANVAALVAGNRYDFVHPERNDPALAEGLRDRLDTPGDATVRSFDARVTGPLANWAGGSIGLAAGIERRSESMRDGTDKRCVDGLMFAYSCFDAQGSRTMSAAYGELSIPFGASIESQLAVRHEQYSDYGSSTVPKVAASWRPAGWILLRAGYNEGFRAPSLAQLFTAPRVNNSGSVVDPVRCNGYRAAFGTGDPRSVAACRSQPAVLATGGNPALRAEESRMGTLGFVVEPVRDFSVSADYWDIRLTDKIVVPNRAFIIANAELYPGAVIRSAPSPDDTLAGVPGAISQVNTVLYNSESEATRGFDLDLRYRSSLGEWGKLALSSLNTYVDRFRRTSAPGQPPQEVAGSAGDRQRYRGLHTATWTLREWESTIAANVVGPYAGTDPSTGEPKGYARWATMDVQVAYRGFAKWRLTAGVRSLFVWGDAMNISDGVAPWSGIERFVYGRASFTFR